MSIAEMIRTHPRAADGVNDQLVRCIEECQACAAHCISCADACLGEEMVAELRACIRLNLDCADVCTATAAIAARCTEGDLALIRSMLATCALACRACGDECASHADQHEHCWVCAEACRRCEKACREAIQSLE